MKLTDKARVQGVPYIIELVPNLRADVGYSGLATPTSANIKLDAGMCMDMLLATKLHEFLEVFNSEHELGLSHHQMQSLATCLYQLINDNPEIFKND
jgi:hypothetical protein